MCITIGGKSGTWGGLFLHCPALLPHPGPMSPMHLPSASLVSPAGPQEVRRWDCCSRPPQSPSLSSSWAETLPRGPWPQHRALRVRNLPCLFTKCFISCLSEAASRGVRVLKRRRGYRSVVPGMGRGCRWKEPELEEEERRWLVVKMSHGGMR